MTLSVSTIEALLYEEESSTLDFKKEQYPFQGAGAEQKGELLKDILAFANASRTDDAFILIGVEEIQGGKSEVIGISDHFDDANLQQFVNSKTQKPIDFHYIAIEIEGKQIGVIRISAQNRPIYLLKDFGRLKKGTVYIRRGSSTDIALPDEITQMAENRFDTPPENPGEALSKKRQDFKLERIEKIHGGETPVKLKNGGKLILHMIPNAAFSGNIIHDIQNYALKQNGLQPMGASGWNNKPNVDGYLVYRPIDDNGSAGYTQLFRTGIIEAVYIFRNRKDIKYIPSLKYEEVIIKAITCYLKELESLSISLPVHLFLTLTDIKGYELGVSHMTHFYHGDEAQPLDRNFIDLQEIEINSFEVDEKKLLQPLFDQIWNAFGYMKSFNYDSQGNWGPPRI